MTRSYTDFLRSKLAVSEPSGFDAGPIDAQHFDFQQAIERWALARGRAAVFADCGLGKTPIQLEWARQVTSHADGPVLIVAPLAVSQQTIAEGVKFGVPVRGVRKQSEVSDGVSITNYEMLGHFDREAFAGIVLDESSILKSFDGKTRKELTEFGSGIPFRLCCTATPAPNDLFEILNHAEFLGVMSGKEILAVYFRQDGNTTHRWRLKGHAEAAFWKWLASWSVAIRTPADLGFDGSRFELPDLSVEEVVVGSDAQGGELFPIEARTMNERRQARRDSLGERVATAADLVKMEPDEQWLVWCNLNAESEALRLAIPGAVEVRGSDSRGHKRDALLGFQSGAVRVLITKPTIAGYGMNWQNCARAVFVGLSDSYEQYYQAMRRIWRFGQTREVQAYIVIAETEGAVLDNIKRKEAQAAEMFDSLIRHVSIYQMGRSERETMTVENERATGDGWELLMGDSCERISEISPGSIGLWVFSPPFPGMYAYTNSEADVGNSSNMEELLEHFGFMIPKMLAATMPGRMCCVHLTQEPVFKHSAGYAGRKDFRGAIIAAMEAGGWIYYSEVTIDKNPQIKAARTKDHALLFKTLGQNSEKSAPCMADYLLIFKAPGDSPNPVRAGTHPRWNPDGGWITADEWIEWAAPVWYRKAPGYPGGIVETDVLPVRGSKDEEDEKHLCPLQTGVIERAVKLWSNPGDVVGDPFAGIGSTGYVAIQHGRDFWGCELKPSYWRAARGNLIFAETNKRGQAALFQERPAR